MSAVLFNGHPPCEMLSFRSVMLENTWHEMKVKLNLCNGSHSDIITLEIFLVRRKVT